MSKGIDLVKRFNLACETRDFDTIESMLHPSYTLLDPIMSFDNPQDFIRFMKDCTFTCSLQDVSFVEQGNKVAQTLDAVMTAPVPYRFRMCDIITIEEGKIRSEETFYDTAQIPPEAKEASKRDLERSQKAA